MYLIKEGVEILKNQKGMPSIYKAGYSYTLYFANDGIYRFRCVKRKGCKANCSFENGVFQFNFEHNHAPNPVKVLVAKAKLQLSQLATTSPLLRTDQIVQEFLSEQTPEVVANVAPEESLKRYVRMTRQDGNQMMRFGNRQEIAFPNEVAHFDLLGESIITFDTGREDPQRIIGFSNSELLEITAECQIFQMDGTFKIVPSQFDQLYTIHGWYRGRCFPLLYALLPNRAQATYQRLLQFLSQQTPNQSPKFIIDMEMAAKNAILSQFPTASIVFCFFHFAQVTFIQV